MERIDLNKGVFVLVEGAIGGGFTVSVITDGNRNTFPGTMELEDALSGAMYIQQLAGLPDERVLVEASGILDNANRSLAARKVKVLMNKHGII